MIDFQNAAFVKLKQVDNNSYSELVLPLFAEGEQILSTYKGIRDGLVFTNRRILSINMQGLTGKKKDFTSLPYNKIQVFSVETAGLLDLDSELELWFSGIGKIRFEFVSGANVGEICRAISNISLR